MELNSGLAVECLILLFSTPLSQPSGQEKERTDNKNTTNNNGTSGSTTTTSTSEQTGEISLDNVLFSDYLNGLLEIELSLPSMEVINRLSNSSTVNLPYAFFHLYILKSIKSCEVITDKYGQVLVGTYSIIVACSM